MRAEKATRDVEVLGPLDVFDALSRFAQRYGRCQCLILDPWYNKGVGGVRDNYDDYLRELIKCSAPLADHVFVWGFPEILARQVCSIPDSHHLNAWLTWYYKNNPSVIRGWRSSQNACLHLTSPGALLYPEHFLNEEQLRLHAEGKLRYMPAPTTVIEAPLNIGFINRTEQTGHPAQKPLLVFERLVRMTTKPGDLVFDPMCGSGTTGIVCRVLGRRAVLSDIDPTFINITEERLKTRVHDNYLTTKLGGETRR